MTMRPSNLRLLLLGLLITAFSPVVSRAQQPPAASATAAVDPKADEILRKMGATLQAAKSVSFTSHAIVDHAREDGQRVQYAKNQKVQLRRPDKLAGDVSGDVEDLQFRYDGKQVAIYNARTNSWGSIP